MCITLFLHYLRLYTCMYTHHKAVKKIAQQEKTTLYTKTHARQHHKRE